MMMHSGICGAWVPRRATQQATRLHITISPWAASHSISTARCPVLLACRYSDAELKALQEPAEGQNGGAAQPAAAPQPVDPVALKKQLLGLIPKDKAGAFAELLTRPGSTGGS